MKEFTAMRAKTYSYLGRNNNEDKRIKDSKKSFVELKLKFEDYKKQLQVNRPENKINQRKKKIKTDIGWRKSSRIHKKTIN